MREWSARSIKKFFCALGRGLLEQIDLAEFLGEGFGGIGGVGGILGVLGIAAFCVVVVCFLQVGYELMFDPNATDVAARLAAISISPEKWM
jgi:hypothetical protein